ncbi:hypothetical protein GW17_00025982 [Ensete ventricosum]|nr:hypothetical protein GW17_00025982 [Ensete ventricosum]
MATSSPVPLSLINRATPKLPDPISFTSSYFSIISPAKVRPQEGERRSRVLRELQRRGGGGGRRKREDEGTRCEETLGYIYPKGLPSTHNREKTKGNNARGNTMRRFVRADGDPTISVSIRMPVDYYYYILKSQHDIRARYDKALIINRGESISPAFITHGLHLARLVCERGVTWEGVSRWMGRRTSTKMAVL